VPFNFFWGIRKWAAQFVIWVLNLKMRWRFQKQLKSKRLGRSTRTALTCRWSIDLTLRRSFRIAAFRVTLRNLSGWHAAVRNNAEIDDRLNMFEIAIPNVLDRAFGRFACLHPSCARRCGHVRNAISHA
jgi:hypothetical protein